MLINLSNIKNGIIVKINNNYFKIINFLHVNPGKGNTFVRTKLKNLINGNIIKYTFFKSSKINKINIISKNFIFLYRKKNNFYFINKKNFNQIYLSKKFLNKKYLFIKENDNVIIDFIKNKKIPLLLKIKKFVILKVINQNIEIKGNSKKKKFKKSILETGLTIYTPYFINIGDYIKINTKNKKYIERVK
ncbi:MAG: elongation factor P [Candidatus Shikimatogenerans sp. JK-2022]|nr:elongation factor P [Candidatus Shikimatogenerans bostrichidophilus]